VCQCVDVDVEVEVKVEVEVEEGRWRSLPSLTSLYHPYRSLRS
jgi:hypothetical protein